MPVRIQHIHKGHQPGDLASFSDAEAETIVHTGVGVIEDPQSDFERALFEKQKTLPPRPVPGRVAEIKAPPPDAGVPDRRPEHDQPELERPQPSAGAPTAPKETPPAPKPAAPAPAKEPVKEPARDPAR